MGEKILIFGDSNTAGQQEYDEVRGASFHARDEHWPAIVSGGFPQFTVLTRGVPGRFAGELGENAALHGHTGFAKELEAIGDIKSLKYIVIALGVNDLQKGFESSADQLNRDLGKYAQMALDYGSNADMIFVGISDYKESVYMRPNPQRRETINGYLRDTFHYVFADDIEHGPDGVHYTKADHGKIATRIIELIQRRESQKEAAK